jgi:solute carrier family 41
MASRLSTEANLGHMEKWSTTLRMIGGDMVLVQCQATVVSFLAAIVAILVNVCQTGTFDLDKCLVICASSLITANVACFLLGIHLTKLLRIHGITHSYS